MDSLFKVLFGFLLGIVVFLGWDYFDARQARERGLVAAWVPVDSPWTRGVPPSHTTSGQAARKGPSDDATGQPGATVSDGSAGGTGAAANNPGLDNPAPTPPPVETVAPPQPKPLDIPTLSLNPRRWPALVTLTQEFNLPLMEGDRLVGEMPLKPGTALGLLKVQIDGRLLVRANNQIFIIPGNYTNILEQALPETGRPTLPPGATAPVPPVSTTPSTTTPPPSTAPGASRGNGSVFGVPIAPEAGGALPKR